MSLAARTRSEAALVGLAGLDPLRCVLDQFVIQNVANAGHRNRAVGAAHVLLTVEMHSERAVLALHQLQEIVQLLLIDGLESVSRFERDERIHGRIGGGQMSYAAW